MLQFQFNWLPRYFSVQAIKAIFDLDDNTLYAIMANVSKLEDGYDVVSGFKRIPEGHEVLYTVWDERENNVVGMYDNYYLNEDALMYFSISLAEFGNEYAEQYFHLLTCIEYAMDMVGQVSTDYELSLIYMKELFNRELERIAWLDDRLTSINTTPNA